VNEKAKIRFWIVVSGVSLGLVAKAVIYAVQLLAQSSH
jgi:hypothetical protein